MFILKCTGDFQDCERGMITRKWAQVDEDGRVQTFATREAADAAISDTSEYDGIAPWNILSHGQMSGYRPCPIHVSNNRDEWPMWARASGN